MKKNLENCKMCVKSEGSKKNKLNKFIIPESTKHTKKEKITLDWILTLWS